MLVAPGTSIEESVLPELINELAAVTSDTVFVLDDYHLIGNAETFRSVELLVHHLPPTLQLVIATRADPRLPLARLRVRGDVHEMRASDLRFSDAETATLFNDVWGLGLTDGDIIGLQRRLSGPLCDAVIGGSDSQRMLEDIERSNLFLVPLDDKRQWYRYHHLFADLLRSELQTTTPEAVAVLHRRASQWYTSNGASSEAVDHALWGGDLAEAAELVPPTGTCASAKGLLPQWSRGWTACHHKWSSKTPGCA